MRMYMVILLSQSLYLSASAQEDQSFRVNSVHHDSTGLFLSIYRYPQFTQGYILFKNQNLASALVNYNRLSGQILFINSNGDTLEPAHPQSIEYVACANDTFHYFDKAYIRLITHYTGVNLYKKQIIKYNGKEKKGAYGGYSTTTAANSIDKVSNENNIEKIGVDENELYASSTYYYLAGQENIFVNANKKSFRRIFPGKGGALNEYLAKNKINYNKEEDLLNLISYLQKK